MATTAAAATKAPTTTAVKAALINRLLVLAAGLIALSACHEPLERETFIRASKPRPLGSYEFSLPLTDSLRTYSLSFYTRMTKPERKFVAMADTIRYHAVMKSPSGTYYKGNGFFLKNSCTDVSAFSRTYLIPFREDFRPVEYGDWTLYVSLVDEDSLGLDGFGVKLLKKQ